METSSSRSTLTAAWAAVPKWASRSSSDAVGIIAGTPTSLTVVMIDVQGSGTSGTQLARTLLAFATNLLQSGVAGDIAADATRMHLLSLRQGRVYASILIATAHPETDELIVASVGKHLVAVYVGTTWHRHHAEAGETIQIQRIPFPVGANAVIPNDGIAIVSDSLLVLLPTTESGDLARAVLQAAITDANGRPRSDMAVAVLQRSETSTSTPLQAATHSLDVDLLPVRP